MSTTTARLIVSGSREWQDAQQIRAALAFYADYYRQKGMALRVLVGDNRYGSDMMARQACDELHIPKGVFRALWQKDGKGAGYKRDTRMIESQPRANGMLAFWDGKSPGTKQAMEAASKLGIRVKVNPVLQAPVAPPVAQQLVTAAVKAHVEAVAAHYEAPAAPVVAPSAAVTIYDPLLDPKKEIVVPAKTSKKGKKAVA